MALDWDKLRYFETVAEAGSFTEAARRLHMSQPALSRQIQALEEAVGAALFHRHARGLVLTHEGEQLHELTHEMADRIERAQVAIEASRDRPTGEVRLATTVSFGSTWLARQLHEFIELYPDLNVVLCLSDDDVDLSKRQADCAIRFHASVQSDLIQKRLVPIRQRICAAPSYLERFGEPKTAEELDHHRLLAYGPSVPDPLKDTNWILDVGHQGPSRTPVLAINNLYGILQAAETGVGIAVLPSYLIRFSGRLKPILPEVQGPAFHTYFVYPPELRRSVRVTVLRDFIVRRMTVAALDGKE